MARPSLLRRLYGVGLSPDAQEGLLLAAILLGGLLTLPLVRLRRLNRWLAGR